MGQRWLTSCHCCKPSRVSDPKHITIRRERGFYGILRALRVNVDGKELLRIKHGQVLPAVLPAHAKVISLQMDWVHTEPFSLLDVKDGDTLVISVLRRAFAEMRSITTIPFAISIA